MSVKTFFQQFKARVLGIESAVVAKGSAFVKIAEADAKALEVKGRILAVDAANKAKSELVSFYEKETNRVHAEADQIKSDFDAILAKL